MIKKRIIALTMAMTMGMTVLPMAKEASTEISSKGEVNIVKDKATIDENKVKEMSKDFIKNYLGIEINDEFKGSAYLDQYNNYGEIHENWNINWYKDSYQARERYSVCIDGKTGEIKGIDVYNNRNGGAISVLSYSEAKESAEDFLKKVNKDKFSKCKPLSDNWNGQSGSRDYRFTFVRMENGIEFPQNYLNVNIDGVTGEVIGYQCEWNDELAFPNIDKVISKDKANETLTKEIGVNLKYKEFSNKYEYEANKDIKNIQLTYEKINNSNGIIDATTGEKPLWENEPNYTEKTITLKNKNEYFAKYKEVKRNEEPCSSEEAIQVAEAYIKDNYKGEFQLNRVDYRGDEKEKAYSISYSEKSDKKESYEKIQVHMNIDANTKQINYVNMYYGEKDDKEFEPAITWEEGFNKALDLISKHHSDKIKNLSYDQKLVKYEEENIRNERSYYYSFPRVENGVVFDGNYIGVAIDTKTGEVSSMRTNWYNDAEFEKPNKLYGEKEILDKIKENYYSELKYVYVDVNTDPEITDMQAKTVYEYKNSYSRDYNYYDAFNGKLLDNSGEEAIENIDDFKKQIEKSKNRKALEILAYNGYIDINNFQIDKEVKNKDLMKVLVDALGYRRYVIEENSNITSDGATEDKEDADTGSGKNYMSKEEYLEMAKYYGLIDDTMDMMNPEKEVTREKLSRALINMLQYDIIANAQGIFKTQYKDEEEISKENLGYVALATGLGIIEGEGNKLNPKSIVDYEELYASLYKTLLYKNQVERVIRPWEVK